MGRAAATGGVRIAYKRSLIDAALALAWLACLVPAQWWQAAVYLAVTLLIVEQPRLIVAPLLLTGVCLLGLGLSRRYSGQRVLILRATIGLIVAGWVMLKYGFLRDRLSTALGLQGGMMLPAVIGLSYLFIKLVHVCADAMRPNAPPVRPLTLLAMAVFPPTYQAGPMHRYEEFAASFENLPPLRERDWFEVFRRIVWGLFKVTLLGVTLEEWCLPALNAPATTAPLRLWVAVYCYSFYIYANFSGISDLAIGIGKAFGVDVPENFANPYLKRDIQQFWQSWHITLTRWLQAYLFMPISRRLMKTGLRRRPKLVAWIGYLVTFGFCGLWHGEETHFILWGLYHAIGLGLYASLPARLKAPSGEGPATLSWRGGLWWALTFNFVSFGWILFACPLATGIEVVRRMFLLG